MSVARVLVGKPQAGTRDYGQGGFRTFILIRQGGTFNYLGCVSEGGRRITAVLAANSPGKRLFAVRVIRTIFFQRKKENAIVPILL